MKNQKREKPDDPTFRPRVAIISMGRFHVADLARELSRKGFDVTFYSDVPAFRLNQFGLATVRKVTIWPVTFLTLMERGLGKYFRMSLRISWLKTLVLDGIVAFVLRRCELAIGMSGIAFWSLVKIKSSAVTGFPSLNLASLFNLTSIDNLSSASLKLSARVGYFVKASSSGESPNS